MSIAVVAYEMEGERTGVGRYLEGLLSGIALSGDERRWRLYFKGDPFDHPLWTAGGGHGRFEPVFDRQPRARPILWEQLRLPSLLRRDRPELVFSPAYSLPPWGSAPGVVTVHDLSFELLPEDFPRRERWRRRLLARRAVRKARRVLTDTEQVAADLARTYGVRRDKIGVVPLGVDDKFIVPADSDKATDDETLARYGIRPPYLLHVGSILERRHVHLVIAAFAAVADENPGLNLVLAGRNRLRRRGDLERWIERSGVGEERIAVVGYVSDDHLAAIYRRATLSYYLSSYEGYGLPPLESLAAGTPAVVARGLALDELWPEYPYRAPTLDRAAVVAVTRAALSDDDARRRLAREGGERMARLDWRRAAERFLEEIARA